MLDGDDKLKHKMLEPHTFHAGCCITLRTRCAKCPKEDQQDKELEANISCAVRFLCTNLLFISSPVENTISCCGITFVIAETSQILPEHKLCGLTKRLTWGGQEEEVRGEGKRFRYMQDS